MAGGAFVLYFAELHGLLFWEEHHFFALRPSREQRASVLGAGDAALAHLGAVVSAFSARLSAAMLVWGQPDPQKIRVSKGGVKKHHGAIASTAISSRPCHHRTAEMSRLDVIVFAVVRLLLLPPPLRPVEECLRDLDANTIFRTPRIADIRHVETQSGYR